MAHHDAKDGRAALAAALLAALLAGCTGLGPARVGIDRTDYTERLRQSEKEQLLTNILALPYGDHDESSTIFAQRTGPVARAAEALRAAGFAEMDGYEREF